MSRKLATIRLIDDIIPIPNADRIVIAVLGGWQAIVQKDEYDIGDPCIFCEIDTVLPFEEQYAFLGKSTITTKGIGYRIKTMKLRGVLSQGLVLPMNLSGDYEIGSDVTGEIGAWLHEGKVQGTFKGTPAEKTRPFPYFLRKTDQNRIQNLMGYFEYHKDRSYEVTKKLDGSSMTVWYNDQAQALPRGKIRNPILRRLVWWYDSLFNRQQSGVCSKNVNLRESDDNVFWNVAHRDDLLLAVFGSNVAIQGELIGPNIQNNYEGVKDYKFYAFNVFDIDRQRYMIPHQAREWCRERGVAYVPVVDPSMNVFGNIGDLDNLKVLVEGESNLSNTRCAEGLVFKEITGVHSFKCVSDTYLLKED
jgi:RNA ligase (TIGR02306 family)